MISYIRHQVVLRLLRVVLQGTTRQQEVLRVVLQDTTWYYEVVRVALRVTLRIITRCDRWCCKVLRGTTSCYEG